MRKSIATISVSGTLDAKLDAIAGAGFDGVEIMDADLVASPLRPEDVRARCADLGLRIEIFQPVRDVAGIDPALFPDALRRFRHKLRWAVALGTSDVLVCSTVGEQARPDAGLLAEQLRQLGDAAAAEGVRIAFEALAWGTEVNRVEQSWAAVRAADHDHVALAVDTFHLAAAGDGPEALAGIPGDRIAFLQIADAPYLQMAPLEWSRHHRCFPGQGQLDVAGMVGAVLDAGYAGPLSLEVFSDLVREARPERTARDALRSLVFLEEGLRERSRWRDEFPREDLVALPAAAHDARARWVEITASADAGLGDVLGSLGFSPAAPDAADPSRSAWHNGAASVVLHEPGAEGTEGPAVTAIGVEVDDPARVALRAEGLLWPVHEDGEGVRLEAPSGVSVRLCSPDVAREVAPGGWLGLDHVGTRLDPDDSDSEVSFYRQLFAMDAGPVTEFPDPSGRLRSRDLRTRDGGMRTVLNIAVRGRRSGGPATGVNQLAFATGDLLGAVERMRSTGAPLLRPPAGYYEDLDARFGLDAGLLDRLRTLGVFYDRDSEGGELLHVYSPVIGGRFYLELLERRGGYDGYGSSATPVRLAIQSELAQA